MSEISTKRLTLVPIERRYRDDYLRLATDERVMRFIGAGVPWSIEYADERLERAIAHWSEHGFGWRAMLRNDHEFVGLAAQNVLGDAVPGLPEDDVEIGWWVAPEFWGDRIATEAAEAIRDDAFEHVGATRIVARYRPENVGSGRVMERIGMSWFTDLVDDDGEVTRVYTLDSQLTR